MASLPTLFPNTQIDNGGWSGPAVDQTDIWEYIDETGTGGADRIFGSLDNSTTACLLGLTDMPSDFATMNSIDLEIRHARGTTGAGDNGGGDDTHSLHVMITDSSGVTQLTDEMTVESGTVAYLEKTEVISFTGVHQTANKATWDGARISIRTVCTKNMGGDGDRIWIDFVRIINGDYDSAGESASGGSTSTVTATSEGAGVKDTDGGATSTVATVGSGAGTKKVSGGGTSTTAVSATGAGVPGSAGGSTSTVTQSAEGAGAKTALGGATPTVDATSQGAGVKDASGGADSTVTVVATGAGTSSEGGENKSGGSTATITINAEGAGSKLADEGATSTVTVTSSGAGSKAIDAGSTSTVTIDAQGDGFRSGASGGATSTVTLSASGGGQSSEDEGGGEESTVYWGSARSPRTWPRGTRVARA